MPPSVPDRYRFEMRLGRDHDVEEWLATDTSLDRPVLIRSLGPEMNDARHQEFLRAMRGAARVSHPHLAKVFAVGERGGGVYAVCEWTGGASAANRLESGQTIELDEFLPNAAGLADALAHLHEQGESHGSIDLSAITYSVAHPAKLGAIGRPRTTESDVPALAATLEAALTGAAPGGPPPSESIDGLSPTVDKALRHGQSGLIDASQLATLFRAAPTPRPVPPEPPNTARRALLAAAGLLLLALGLVALGTLFSPASAPIVPVPPTLTTSSTLPSTTTTSFVAGGIPVHVQIVATFDPFGGGGENDDLIAGIVDGDPTTRWRTERYRDPLSLIKPGVGFTITVLGRPVGIEFTELTPETRFELRWATAPSEDPEDWELVAAGTSRPGALTISLPPRDNGTWLFWITELPQLVPSEFLAEVAEVRFFP